MDIYEAVAVFEARYLLYLREIEDVKARTSHIRAAATFLSRARPYADDPIHAKALAELRSLAGDVTTALGDSPAGGAVLARATLLVLREKKMEQTEYWSLVSLEGLVKPWLAFLDIGHLRTIYDIYRRANPRRSSLPNQRELHSEFERLLYR